MTVDAAARNGDFEAAQAEFKAVNGQVARLAAGHAFGFDFDAEHPGQRGKHARTRSKNSTAVAGDAPYPRSTAMSGCR